MTLYRTAVILFIIATNVVYYKVYTKIEEFSARASSMREEIQIMNSAIQQDLEELRSVFQDKISIESSEKLVTFKARVTGYTAKPGQKGALGKPIVSGRTAAVSRNCTQLLGHKVYIDQLGVFEVTDLTAEWVGNRFNDVCTIDIARPNEEMAQRIGNELRHTTKLPISF